MAPVSNWKRRRIGHAGPVEFGALLLLGVFLAVLGPFDTDQRSLAWRLVFWPAGLVGGG